MVTDIDKSKIEEVTKFLDDEFTIKDMGYADFFLGIEIQQSNEGFVLSQNKYILDIMKDACLLEAID